MFSDANRTVFKCQFNQSTFAHFLFYYLQSTFGIQTSTQFLTIILNDFHNLCDLYPRLYNVTMRSQRINHQGFYLPTVANVEDDKGTCIIFCVVLVDCTSTGLDTTGIEGGSEE